MNKILVFIFISAYSINLILSESSISDSYFKDNNNISKVEKNKVLSRKRRYLSFPEGSTFAVVGGLHKSWLSLNSGHMSIGFAIGVTYALPNTSWVLSHAHGFKNEKTASVVKSRSRRDIFDKMALIIDTLGYTGKTCILRGLCETSRYLSKKKGNMVIELVKSILNFPITKYMSKIDFSPEMDEYQKAYRLGNKKKNCLEFYSDCDFSLLEALLAW